MASKSLNGSTKLLPDAMRDVFSECMEKNREGMKDDLKGVEDRLTVRIDGGLETTNDNMQAQFAEQEKKIGKLLKHGE